MSRDQGTYVADMLEACERIRAYTVGVDSAGLRDDQKTVDAIVRNLQVLGEAAKGVSEGTRALAPAIPWRSITGLRDVVVHDYFGIDLDVIADVALVKIPVLHAEVAALLRLLDARE